jgi:hypothetical protein
VTRGLSPSASAGPSRQYCTDSPLRPGERDLGKLLRIAFSIRQGRYESGGRQTSCGGSAKSSRVRRVEKQSDRLVASGCKSDAGLIPLAIVLALFVFLHSVLHCDLRLVPGLERTAVAAPLVQFRRRGSLVEVSAAVAPKKCRRSTVRY